LPPTCDFWPRPPFVEKFLRAKSQIKLFVQILPDAALFLDVYGENLPETYTFLPDADIFVVSSVRRYYIFAAFGKNMERVHTELPDAAIFTLSSGTLAPLYAK
jgi:hypothetical protein